MNCIICKRVVGPTEGATISTYIQRLGRETIRVICDQCQHGSYLILADHIIQAQMKELYR